MTPEAEAAWRVLMTAIGRTQTHLVQRPGVDVGDVLKASNQAMAALFAVQDFLNTDREATK